MARRLLLQWDPEIDGAFRRRLEDALGDLQVEHADIAAVDHDEDAHAVVVVASPHSRPPAHRDPNVLIVLGGPGAAAHASGALRLETDDIDRRSKRWAQVVDRLGAKLDRPGLSRFADADGDVDALKAAALAFPTDPLAMDAAISLAPAVLQERLAVEKSRADAAERSLADAERERADALRDLKRAEAAAGAERARIADLQREIERLTHLAESSAYALASVAAEHRLLVTQARDHAWRARLASARALETAAEHPDALRWPKADATYSGETRNGQPHGYGVMIFRRGAETVASYSGAFEDGRRSGHGVGTSDAGHIWRGQWANDEASGLGLLERPDGPRFEGEVAPDAAGDPRKVRGWTWDGPRAAAVHQPVRPLLTAD